VHRQAGRAGEWPRSERGSPGKEQWGACQCKGQEGLVEQGRPEYEEEKCEVQVIA